MVDFIVSFIIAILSGMGVGGGGLLVIYLVLFKNTPQIIAQGANLCFFIIAAIASTIYNIKKSKIVWKTTLIMSASGILFTLAGSFVAGMIGSDFLRKIFGAMLIITVMISLFPLIKNKIKR